MASALEDARAGRPWSVIGVVRGLDDELDDEGRPLSERRAPSVVKDGVPIVLKACPYHDERRGVMMNVSALGQVTAHLAPVLADIHAFGAATTGGTVRYGDMLTTVIDQLAAPALFLLQHPGTRAPAVLAVSHKLAAGFYGVATELAGLEAAGCAPPAEVDALMAHVHASGALLGASEVCAGPEGLIRRAAEAMLAPEGSGDDVPATRVELAATLAAQVRLGLLWERCDLGLAGALLGDAVGLGAMRPRNAYMAARLQERSARVEQGAALHRGATEWSLLCADPTLCRLLGAPLAEAADSALYGPVEALWAHGDGAVGIDAPDARARASEIFVRHLQLRRCVAGRLEALERRLRRALGFDSEVPPAHDPWLMGPGHVGAMLEAALGHRIECEVTPTPRLRLRNHRRVVSLPPPSADGVHAA